MPGGVAEVPEGLTRRYWLTVRTPADARPGLYAGTVTIRPEQGGVAKISAGIPRPQRARSTRWTSPPAPSAITVGIPWYGDDPRAAEFNRRMNERGLRKLREYGFTAFSGAAVDRLSRLQRRQAGPRLRRGRCPDEAGEGPGVPGRGQLRRAAYRASTPITSTAARWPPRASRITRSFLKAVYSADPETRHPQRMDSRCTTTSATSRSATT